MAADDGGEGALIAVLDEIPEQFEINQALVHSTDRLPPAAQIRNKVFGQAEEREDLFLGGWILTQPLKVEKG